MSDLFLEPEETDHASHQGDRARSTTSRRRRRRTITTVMTIVAVGVIGLAVAQFIGPSVGSPSAVAKVDDYPGPGEDQVEVTVSKGDTGQKMAAKLVAADVVATEKAFLDAYAANSDADKIQPGTYVLLTKSRAADAVTALLDPGNRQAYTIMVPEGLTAQQTYQRIADALEVPLEEVQDAAEDTAALGLPDEANGDIEGWLFPNTYEYDPKLGPAGILTTMIAECVRQLDDRSIDPADRESLLIEASIIEREVNREEDRPKVARVIENRLAAGKKLEMDSTVQYISGRPGIATTKEERQSKDKHNTYVYEGLPIGPISNPGAASIDAALNPADGPWMYFVVVNPETGETEFNETYEQHQQSVAKWRAWEDAKKASASPSD